MKVLVTGGAGFIESHTVDLLVERGFDVRILDNLEDQVHEGEKPEYLSPEAEFISGDITNRDVWKKCLKLTASKGEWVHAKINCDNYGMPDAVLTASGWDTTPLPTYTKWVNSVHDDWFYSDSTKMLYAKSRLL